MSVSGGSPMPEAKPRRAHLIAGGFPPGSMGGHDHDYARLQAARPVGGARGRRPRSSNDFADVEKWLPVIASFLVTYVAGPYPDTAQTQAIADWLDAGGRWLALHGTSGGRAQRVEGPGCGAPSRPSIMPCSAALPDAPADLRVPRRCRGSGFAADRGARRLVHGRGRALFRRAAPIPPRRKSC